jgi:hypothetical protein
MSPLTKRTLFWAPRILSIVIIAFASFFALGVFDRHLGFWQAAYTLTICLIPSFVLIAVLILAWRWEWIGAAFYAAVGLFYLWAVVDIMRPISLVVKLPRILKISGPAFLIAWLFLANWLKRDEINKPGTPPKRLEENVEEELPVPSKGRRAILVTLLMLEAMAVIAFAWWLVRYTGGLLSRLHFNGSERAMFVASRAAAFAGILAFLHWGVRACWSRIHRSRGWLQRIGFDVLMLIVIALTLAALVILLFSTAINY